MFRMPAPHGYGSGYINGTIIGLPKNGGHVDQAWDLVKYLTTNTHALAVLSNGLRNVPSTVGLDALEGVDARLAFRAVPEDLRQSEVGTLADHRFGQLYINLVQQFVAKWQAGKVEGSLRRAQ